MPPVRRLPVVDAASRPELGGAQPSPFRADTRDEAEFSDSRVRLLVRMRWGAIAMITAGAVSSYTGLFPGLNGPVMGTIAVVAAAYNLALSMRRSFPARAGVHHAYVDVVILTLVLWASGGVHTPFVANYFFHVTVVGVLGGARSTLVAAALSVVCGAFLALTSWVPGLRIATWDPVPPWDVISEASAFIGVLAAIAYSVWHAVNDLKEREVALAQAGDAMALEYQVLTTTLSQLDAGLELIDADGSVMWRNKRAAELSPWAPVGGKWECPGDKRPCQRDAEGVCPIHAAGAGEPGRCRFAARVPEGERVYEMVVFPLAPPTDKRRGDQPRTMNLYLDRTASVIDERGLILAERLASLGRVTQGVAHELNTPLATIRTLAADMRAALREFEEADDAQARRRLVDDVAESAELVQDETRRLGRITQGLLTGGDVVRSEIEGEVPLAAVVERARALVFAGARGAPPVDIGEGVDELAVVADRDRLVQVLVNLMQNAYDAVRDEPDARVRIRAERRDESVRVVVEDDGPGLPVEIRARLFEPFATTKPPGKGTGLGLYTSYMLVHAMHGDIEFEEGPQGGTHATVTLPAGRPATQRPAASAEASA